MIRLLADADLDEGIVSGCLRREPTMDFLTANDAKLRRLPDSEVLRVAAEQDRILVSHDFRTATSDSSSKPEIPAQESFS